MYLLQTSVPLTKALKSGNSVATSWQSLDMLPAPPETFYTDGFATQGLAPGQEMQLLTDQRLLLIPYAEGATGSQFSVRIYGWHDITRPADGLSSAGQATVWIPYLIVELACTVCNRGGPPSDAPGVGVRQVKQAEQACDTIAVSQGALGLRGYVNSTGPGTDLIAWAVLELPGSRRVSFDFQAADTGNNIGMNCLYASQS